MTIIKFAEQFPNENSCKVDFKQKRERKVYPVKNVTVQNTIGLLINGNFQIADSEILYEA